MDCHNVLSCPPKRLALEDMPSPTSFGLTDKYYIGAKEIFNSVFEVLQKDIINTEDRFKKDHPHDVPGDWFKGPF